MSDEPTPSPDENEAAEAAGENVNPPRRTASPKGRKTAKRAKPVDPADGPPVEVEAPAEPGDETAGAPEVEEAPAPAGEAAGEWPEPAVSEGGAAGGSKRKRRRKKKGGQHLPVEGAPAAQEGENGHGAPAHAPAPPPRPKHDSDLVAKHAWKIYLAEISEEGVALVGDNDARELARRCFRLSEIFLDEQSRRR